VRNVGFVIALGLLVLVGLLSLAIGTKPIALGQVIHAFTAFDGSNDHLVVRELRLPRPLLGLVVGSSLGVSGALMQGVTRNPLAEPAEVSRHFSSADTDRVRNPLPPEEPPPATPEPIPLASEIQPGEQELPLEALPVSRRSRRCARRGRAPSTTSSATSRTR
jgi:hypothetical protein